MSDSFHIRHQVVPEFLAMILRELNERALTMEELAERSQSQGFKAGTLPEQLTRLRMLGLLSKKGLKLTDAGRTCAQISYRQPSLFYELLHFYHYSLWDERHPNLNRFSWTYRTVCQSLWELAEAPIDNRSLLERVMAELMVAFPADATASLSTNSIDQVIKWLRVLEPRVIRNGMFARRSFAPPELAVLAINDLHERHSIPLGELVALDQAVLRRIAVLCLVDESVLSEILTEAARRFQWFELQEGWGYYVRLHKVPELTEGE